VSYCASPAGPPTHATRDTPHELDVEWFPGWGPDGSLITFGRTLKGDMDVVVMARDGEPVPITDSSADEVSPSGPPAGDRIACLSARGRGLEPFWVPPTGGRELRISSTDVAALEECRLRHSPAGSMMRKTGRPPTSWSGR
jgi:hypothetical protein